MRVNQIDNKEVFKKQHRLSLANFGAEMVNLVPSIINAFFANSLIVWADCFASFESTAHYLIVAITTKRMQNDDGSKYNFGVDRLETTISFVCDAFIAIGYLVVIIISATQIATPEQPTSAIGIFLILKSIDIVGDVFFYIQGKIAERKHPSRLNETECAKLASDLLQDVIMGILVSICYFFRDYKWSWYVSPIATIILSGAFTISAVKRLKEEFGEITDVSTTLADQDKMFDILLEYPNAFKKIREVNCHFLNHKLLVEIKASFRKEVTYEQQLELLKEITAKADKCFNNCSLRFVIENENQIYEAETE